MYESLHRRHPLRSSCNIILNFRRVIMPNIKSAKKRVKVAEAKNLRNRMFKSQMKTITKKYYAAVESGDKAAAELAYKAAVKKVDQAVSHGIIHKNAAARKKSQFTKLYNTIGA